MSKLTGALIGTTNIKMLPQVGKGVEVDVGTEKIVIIFDEIEYTLLTSKVQSSGVKTYKNSGFTIFEIVTEKELYFIALAGVE